LSSLKKEKNVWEKQFENKKKAKKYCGELKFKMAGLESNNVLKQFKNFSVVHLQMGCRLSFR